jgi:hypothetical protein
MHRGRAARALNCMLAGAGSRCGRPLNKIVKVASITAHDYRRA